MEKGIWYEIHCHSSYSKGHKIEWEGIPTPKEIVIAAKQKGLSGVAITDHSCIKGWKEAAAEARKQKIVFIPAMEIDSGEGHILAYGINEHIHDKLGLLETCDRIRAQGGASIAAHPYDIKNQGCRGRLEFTDAVEVFNSLNMDRISNMMAERKARRLRLNMTSGSDSHTLETLGIASNLIDAHDVDGFIKSIKRGDVEFTKNYTSTKSIMEWSRERLTRSYPSVISYIDSSYLAPKAFFVKFVLNSYLKSPQHAFWHCLAKFGMSMTVLYGGVKIVRG